MSVCTVLVSADFLQTPRNDSRKLRIARGAGASIPEARIQRIATSYQDESHG